MIKYRNKEIKHSILLAGMPIDRNLIHDCLYEGIRIFWFGKPEGKALLKAEFGKFVDADALYLYDNPRNIKIHFIDGEGIYDTGKIRMLKMLESGDHSFNLEQYRIEHDDSAPLIIVKAGAGSGKTYVMNNRILYLLHTKENLRMRDIVMVTFTNEATDSMRQKLVELIETKFRMTGNQKYLQWVEEVSQISISTIHSFLRKIILEVGPLLGYGNDLKMSSMVMAKKKILRDIMDERYEGSNQRVQGVLGLPITDLEKLAMQYWTKIENNGLSSKEVFEMDWGTPSEQRARRIQETLRQIFKEVEDRYNNQKKKDNTIAMGDIIHEFSRLLGKKEIVKDYITSQYKYLFCDEFQDSDDIQIKTLAVLDSVYDGRMFVVGDIKQSIYRFRGATDSAFDQMELSMKEEFGTSLKHVDHTLSKNYRTSEDILKPADEIFRLWQDKGFLKYRYKDSEEQKDVLIAQKAINGFYKQIRLSDRNSDDRRVKTLGIINEIRARIAGQEKDFKEKHPGETFKKKRIIILTRSNWQLQEVKTWLKGQPCLIKEKGTFFVSPAVKEFCALIEAFEYESEPMYFYNLMQTGYLPVKPDIEKVSLLAGSHTRLMMYFQQITENRIRWDEYKNEFRMRPVMAVLCELIEKCNPSASYGSVQYAKYLENGKEKKVALDQAVIDAKQYEANLQKLLQMLADTFSGESATLYDIGNYLRIRMNTDNDEENADIPGEDTLDCIMGATAHGSKGLEFDYVIIPYMNDVFEKQTRSEILIEKTDGNRGKVGWIYRKGNKTETSKFYEYLYRTESKELICDETRLLYVAMTRAKEGLYCLTNKRNPDATKTWSDLLPEARDE